MTVHIDTEPGCFKTFFGLKLVILEGIVHLDNAEKSPEILEIFRRFSALLPNSGGGVGSAKEILSPIHALLLRSTGSWEKKDTLIGGKLNLYYSENKYPTTPIFYDCPFFLRISIFFKIANEFYLVVDRGGRVLIFTVSG